MAGEMGRERGLGAERKATVPGFATYLRVLLCLTIFSSGSLSALDPSKRISQYSRSSWQITEGLPQETVRAIAQTEDGFLWVGTEAGLVKFDGARMQVFNRRSDPDIFRNSHIYALETAPDGTLWIGTNGGGLASLKQGFFRRFGLEHGLPSGRVSALAISPSGALWIGTYGGGLVEWRDGDPKVYDAASGMPSPVIFDLAIGPDGAVWVATYGGGVAVLRDGELQVLNQETGLVDDHVWAVLPTTDGSVWIGTNSGLQRWREGEGLSRPMGQEQGLSHPRVISLVQDRDDNLWIGTYGGGLNRYRDGEFEHIDRTGGLSSSHIWRLFEDREGSLWLGTLGGGLSQLKDGPFTTISNEEGLSSDLPSSFFEDEDQGLFIASRDNGLDRLTNGGVESWSTRNGLTSNNLWGVLRDSRGDLWVATSGRGVDRLHDGVWRNYGAEQGLRGSTIFTLIEDRSGDIWLGSNLGLNRFVDGKFEVFTTDDGLVSNQIRALVQSQDGRLWVGTSAGLSVFDGEAFSTIPGLEVARISSILEDQDRPGLLWLGTDGDGVIRFEAQGHFAFNTEVGFFDDLVRAVVEDDFGFLWIATSRGIIRVAKQALMERDPDSTSSDPIPYVPFGERDGMKSSSCYGGQPAGLKTRDGRVWFATLDGVVVVDPATLRSVPAPRVVLEGFWVDDEPMPSGAVLPPGGRAYRVAFSAPTLLIPEKISLRYRLRGFDDPWRRADESGMAQFNNLMPGRYVFEVTASDENGNWTGEVSRLPFTVRPSFRQTKGFFFLCGLGAIALGLALHFVRVRHLRRRERLLNERVEQAVASVQRLRGMLPICACCKKIRSDEGYWEQIETYIDQHSEASFSHGMCPDCARDFFPELVED